MSNTTSQVIRAYEDLRVMIARLDGDEDVANCNLPLGPFVDAVNVALERLEKNEQVNLQGYDREYVLGDTIGRDYEKSLEDLKRDANHAKRALRCGDVRIE